MESRNGLVHVITGDGRGKTTSSLGLALRAIGQGFKVYMIQFLKSGDTGELFAVKKYLPSMTIVQFGKDALEDKQLKMFEYEGGNKVEIKPVGPKGGGKYYHFPSDNEEAEPARRALEHAFNIIKKGEHDVVILDEINCSLKKGLIPIQAALDLIKEKPQHVELLFTGRDAPKELMEVADYVSEVRRIKHPYDRGILARRGIEY
ncbi:MAG: cob(I)yrinic acid a,c-diamide adenosyltransferase [Nanoarchaeota archaeon]